MRFRPALIRGMPVAGEGLAAPNLAVNPAKASRDDEYG